MTARELHTLGRELEHARAFAVAGEAYELAGDVDDQARMLVESGAIDRLEQVLGSEQARQRAERQRSELSQRIKDLVACGRRREALSMARPHSRDENLVALARRIEETRVHGPLVRLLLDGEDVRVAFGEPAVIGRSDASIVIPSPGISRQHLALRRTPNGPEVADLGSRNGTTLRGVRLDVPVAIGEGLELVLGGDVRLELSATDSGGVRIQLVDGIVLAPLGPLSLGSAVLDVAEDGWLELEAHTPCFLSGLQVDRRIQLCRGDALGESADARPRIEVR